MYGRTRAEASQKLTVLPSKTAAGIPLAGEAWTVRSYADHWLETWPVHGLGRPLGELPVRRVGAYRAESRLCSAAIPDAGSGASFLG